MEALGAPAARGSKKLEGALFLALLIVPALATPQSSKPIHVIAHRGASAYAPENTMPAFEHARKLGAREVELDVQLSRDDVVVLFHDATLDKKTNGTGRVRDHDVAKLLELDIGTWFDAEHPEVETPFAGTGLITLQQLFDRFGARFYYHVEIKSEEPELPGKILDLLRAAGLQTHAVISSFRMEQLVRTRALDPLIQISLLVGDERKLRRNTESGEDRAVAELATLQGRWLDLAFDARFDQVAFPSEEMNRELVARARGKGLAIRAYRIRNRADMEHALAVGAGGMTINWPDWLVEP